MFVSFTVNAILKILSIFLFKILFWQCWKTAVVHHSEMRITRWLCLDLSWSEQVQPLPPSPIVPLVAVLAERLLEWCTEKDEYVPPVPRRQVDERV